MDAREFRGEKTLSVVIRDWRPSDADFTVLLVQERLYEKLRRNELLSQEEKKSLLPQREILQGSIVFCGKMAVGMALSCFCGIG